MAEILQVKNREKEKKRSKKSSQTDSQSKPRCAHVLRIAADLNQPLTRVPTHTPCGETGSEDSWLRIPQRSNLVPPTILL